MDIVEIRVVLQTCVGRSTHEIAEVAEHESRHDGIEIHDTDGSSCFVEENVVDLGITVVDVFRQFAFAEESLRQAHFFSTAVNSLDDIGTSCFSAHRVCCKRFVELLQTELNIMEIRDGFAEFIERQVCQLALETTESFASQFRGLRRHFLLRRTVFDKHINAPIVAFRCAVIEFTVFGRHKFQDFAFDVLLAGCFQFATNMIGHLTDILLQTFHILENMVVNTLQEIRFLARMFRTDDEGIVDKAYFQRLRVCHFIRNGKMLQNLFHDIID